MKKLVMALLLILVLATPSFARGGFFIQVFLPPIVFGDSPYCSTPEVLYPQYPVYQYPVYNYPVYQVPIIIYPRPGYFIYHGRRIR